MDEAAQDLEGHSRRFELPKRSPKAEGRGEISGTCGDPEAAAGLG